MGNQFDLSHLPAKKAEANQSHTEQSKGTDASVTVIRRSQAKTELPLPTLPLSPCQVLMNNRISETTQDPCSIANPSWKGPAGFAETILTEPIRSSGGYDATSLSDRPRCRHQPACCLAHSGARGRCARIVAHARILLGARVSA